MTAVAKAEMKAASLELMPAAETVEMMVELLDVQVGGH